MTDGKISGGPISEIHSEDGAQELVRSERMKPYLALLKAQIGGQDTEPFLTALAALPLEERYVWRVISALKWAFFAASPFLWSRLVTDSCVEPVTKLVNLIGAEWGFFVVAEVIAGVGFAQ